ncbi:MAG: glycosyl hydrolase [Alistipes indistinctus]
MKKNLFFVLLLCSVLQGTSQTPAEFKSPTDRYRPKPLWFWNNTTVTRKGIDTQLKALKEQAGYGGVSILPFGAKFGPKYLSPEYFDLYEYTAGKAEALGMQLHYTTNTDSRAAAAAR